MKIEELVQSAKQSVPSLKQVRDEDAQTLVREILRHILQKIEETPEGTFAVESLGEFRVKQLEREKDGRKKRVRRVAFRKAKKQ